MATARRFEEIVAWQEARKLNKAIYKLSAVKKFARDFGLKDQIRRASISGMANIAEGFDCESKREFARFLEIARRSVVEVQSLLYAAYDVEYISESEFQAHYAQAAKTKGLIGAFRKTLLK